MLLDRLAARESEPSRGDAGKSHFSRRSLLRVGAAVGGGLLLEVMLPLPPRPTVAAEADGFAPSAFVRIGRDGTVLRYAGITINSGSAGSFTITANRIGFGAA